MTIFEKIKKFYKLGLWKEYKVLQAVEMGVITQEQADEILKKER